MMVAARTTSTQSTGPSRRAPVEKLDAPITITMVGETRQFTSRHAIMDALRGLERHEVSLNREAALAAFHLGQAIIAVYQSLAYRSLNHLYNDANIHARRAQRAVRFAKEYATQDGAFDFDAYHAGELAARNRHEQGTDACKFDSEGNPSLSAVQRAVGHRAAQRQANTNEHNGTHNNTHKSTHAAIVSTSPPAMRFDPMASLNLVAQMHEPTPLNVNHFQASSGPKGVTAGTQLMIDFDLCGSSQRLARATHLADVAHKQGRVSDAQARALNEAITHAITQAEQMIEESNNQTRTASTTGTYAQ